MIDALLSFAQKFFPGKISATSKIEKLFGQASARQYFRLQVDAVDPYDRGTWHAPAPAFIIMQLPQGFSSPAEEITKIGEGAPKEFPFINVQKYLKALDLNVPEIYGYDAKAGLILLEDIGDDSLERTIAKTDENLKIFYYKKVIETLVQLQVKTLKNPSPDCIAYHRHFDTDLLHWEIMHFLEYGIEDRFKLKVTADERRQFDQAARTVCDAITKLPYGFTHRDFQSRNLHLHNYDFYLIDFQDALEGPLVYDLVALLRDSYVNFLPDQRDTLIKHYVDSLPPEHPYHGKLNDVKRAFHLVALQRKLKDTGRFQYINTVKGNPNFLKSVPQSLAYVRESFDELCRNGAIPSAIYEISKKYIKELQ